MRLGKKKLWIALCSAVLLIAGCAEVADPPVRIDSARIRLPVPGSDKAVGYFQLTNNTDSLLTLTGARADGIRTIEMHTMIRDGDMMRMRRLQRVEVAAGETVEFVSGGNHLMMFGVGELGERVEVILETEQGDELRHQFTTFSP